MVSPTQSGMGVFRRVSFFLMVFALMGFLTWMFADLLWRVDVSVLNIALVLIFSVLSYPLCVGFWQAIIGFFSGLRERPPAMDQGGHRLPKPRSIAVNIPVYNEDIEMVLLRLKALYLSLKLTGQLDLFDFYLLSDSNRADSWVSEEYGWARLCRQLDAFDRIFYRRRKRNIHQKAGNLLDFCESWGRRYTYMVVLDADSLMDGGSLVTMAARMEADPKLGILQTIPLLTRARTRYGLLQQFANRLYGPLFSRGMNFWQGRKGNYWGHNAIIRVDPFIRHCALPDLPGRPPLGGKILSHDFVEAALMVKAGYAVRMDTSIGGSFEEGPPDALDSAMRDRRWCQGNLQHFWLLFAEQLHWASKLHFINGIFAYAGSLLWLLFLTLSTALAFEWEKSRLTLIPVHGTSPVGSLSIGAHALLLFGLVMSILILPKLLGYSHAALSPSLRGRFGGFVALTSMAAGEFVFSTLLAPVMMVFHSSFVLLTLSGKGIGWATQTRDHHGLAWWPALRSLRLHTASGLLLLLLSLQIGWKPMLWLSPIWAGLLLSVPLVVLSSRPARGWAARRFARASQSSAIEDQLTSGIINNDSTMAFFTDSADGFQNAVVDPMFNSIHVSILRETHAEETGIAVPEQSFFKLDPAGISPQRLFNLLESEASMRKLHHMVWRLSEGDLHPVWQRTIERYTLKPIFAP